MRIITNNITETLDELSQKDIYSKMVGSEIEVHPNTPLVKLMEFACECGPWTIGKDSNDHETIVLED